MHRSRCRNEFSRFNHVSSIHKQNHPSPRRYNRPFLVQCSLPIQRRLLRSTKTNNWNLSGLFSFAFILIPFCALAIAPTISSEYLTSQHNNRNSGHFYISQLCAGNSQFPVTKRVEGAVLYSTASDVDVNCTITFKTKSTQQHFIVRFEELKLGCDDHLKMFDSDIDYGQPSIKDFSCRDNLANVPTIKTIGTYLTLRFSSDGKSKPDDGFRLVITAVIDVSSADCPADYSLCHNRLCISRSLYCDEVNHCLDNSDEATCSSRNGIDGTTSGSLFAGDLSLSNALGLFVILVLIIFTCVIIFITAIYCRRESHYAQYQHHLQRAIGVPLQSSSSLMFAHQPQYHYFQPANLSPYITPTHHAIATTLPRGYSTLPLNLAPRQGIPQQQQPSSVNKTNHIPNEYLMMAGLTGPPTAAMQAAPTMQTNLFLPTSQSILATNIRQPTPQERR